jgi:hypothetical protein
MHSMKPEAGEKQAKWRTAAAAKIFSQDPIVPIYPGK